MDSRKTTSLRPTNSRTFRVIQIPITPRLTCLCLEMPTGLQGAVGGAGGRPPMRSGHDTKASVHASTPLLPFRPFSPSWPQYKQKAKIVSSAPAQDKQVTHLSVAILPTPKDKLFPRRKVFNALRNKCLCFIHHLWDKPLYVWDNNCL